MAQALLERGLLAPGRRRLEFAVGQEPLTTLFADASADIVATNLDAEEARKDDWVDTAQPADSLDKLNLRGLCDPEKLK